MTRQQSSSQSGSASNTSAINSLNNKEKLMVRIAATFVEIIGGQPLDRIKVNLQLPKADRLPFRTLLQGGIGSFYAASATSVIQRCFFYIPAIYFGADLWDYYFRIEGSPILDGFAASCFASAIVTPGVSCFENLKLQQQINKKECGTLRKTLTSIYRNHGVRGLFPSIGSTFSREAAFALGVCYLSPTFHQYLKESHGVDSAVGAGCAAGIATQLLTQPFDTIKTWQEKTRMNFVTSVRTMVQENGARFLFNGAVPRVGRGMWTFSCLFYCTNEFSALYKRNVYDSTESSNPESPSFEKVSVAPDYIHLRPEAGTMKEMSSA